MSNLKKALIGGNTPTRAGKAAAPSGATPANAGGGRTARKVDGGAMTSPGSPNKNTATGSDNGASGGPGGVAYLPSKLRHLSQLAMLNDGIEQLAFQGAGRLIVGATDVELQPGEWLLVRVGPVMDGGLPLNRVVSVQGKRKANADE